MKRTIQTVNIHEAKETAFQAGRPGSQGRAFIIAKAGKPLVKVSALDAPTSSQMQRLGFMTGQIAVPDDFNTMGNSEIEQRFHGR